MAAAYGMDVDDFAAYAGLSINLDRSEANWLALPPLSPRDGERLRMLCRMPTGDLPEPYDGDAPTHRQSFAYCHRCLYLNSVDVTDPYWHARWLVSVDRPWCSSHGQSYDKTCLSALRGHRNMRRLLKFISRKRSTQERATQWRKRMLAGSVDR